AVNAITARYPSTRVKIAAPPGASVDAAVAAATRTVLLKLMPTQQAAIEADYQAALKPMPDGAAKTGGIAVGEQAAAACLTGRDVTENARLLATAAMAMDDALVAVFDAKYTYHLWRPVTAIRNGDVDGNDATERDPSWTPFIDTPMHPEYPCAHCIVSASLGAVLQAELGSGPTPTLSSASSTAGGAVRTWKSVGDFVREVAEARICDGVHYRFSTEVGASMGKQIGELAVKSFPKPIR